MLTLEDCVAFCGLTEEEVLAIAEHEHMPEIAAAAFAEYLTNQEHGTEKIWDISLMTFAPPNCVTKRSMFWPFSTCSTIF